MSQGRLKNSIRMIDKIIVGITVVILLTSISSNASVAIRDISVEAGREVNILLDSPIKSGSIHAEFLRDIVQISLDGATIYPAKVENYSEKNSFNKIFAYQYSPNLVRVRFTVADDAETLRGKVKISTSGKSIRIIFPEIKTTTKSANQIVEIKPEEKEAKLLDKVLGRAEKSKPVEPVRLAGHKDSPSPLRAIFILMILVGGLGIFLFWIKRKASKSQVTAKGGWLANLIPNHMKKQKGFIEVLATTPLGPKQNILLVKIRGQQLVLGVTQDRIQLITQLDSDWDSDSDLLDDPNVSESLSKMFGGSIQTSSQVAKPSYERSTVTQTKVNNQSTFRDEIRKRMDGMRSI